MRAIQKGSSAFVDLMNIFIFQTFPIFIKLVLVTATVYTLYDYQFIAINFSSMALYFIANYLINEWRSKYFKDKTMKDSGYN